MKELFLKKIKVDPVLKGIACIHLSVAIVLLVKFGFNIMPICMIPVPILCIYLKKCTSEVADTYKLKEINEYRITNKQYFELRESIFKKKIKVNEIAINMATNTFESLDIALDISNSLGINDYSSIKSLEKIIRVEVYKAYTDEFFSGLDYPEKITILKEIR